MNKGDQSKKSVPNEVSDDDIARIIGRDNMLRIKSGERPKHFDITNLWGDKPLRHAHGERPDTTVEPLQGTMQARIPKETRIDPIGMGQPSHASTYECHEHDRMLRDYLNQVHRRGPNPHSSDGQHRGSPQAKCSHFVESPQTGTSTTGSNLERTTGSPTSSPPTSSPASMKGKLGSPTTPSSPLSPLQQSFRQFGQQTTGSDDTSNENIQGEAAGGSGPQIRRKQTIITPPSPMIANKELLKSSQQQSQQQPQSDNNNNNNSQQQQQQQQQSSTRPPREQTKSPDVLNIMQTAL